LRISVASCVQADEAASGTEVGELLVGGGLSGSDALLQIQADLGGLPVRRLADTDKASLRGIAFLAGSAGLLWDGLQDACATLRTEAVFTPHMAADERSERRGIWRARVGEELARARAPGRATALEGCA
jgi:glycerol kinase